MKRIILLAVAVLALAAIAASLEGHRPNRTSARPNPHNFRMHPMPHNFAIRRQAT
jgi:hypothetical protein